MKMPVISLVEWQKRFGTEKACARVLADVRWPEGFQWVAVGMQVTLHPPRRSQRALLTHWAPLSCVWRQNDAKVGGA